MLLLVLSNHIDIILIAIAAPSDSLISKAVRCREHLVWGRMDESQGSCAFISGVEGALHVWKLLLESFLISTLDHINICMIRNLWLKLSILIIMMFRVPTIRTSLSSIGKLNRPTIHLLQLSKLLGVHHPHLVFRDPRLFLRGALLGRRPSEAGIVATVVRDGQSRGCTNGVCSLI